MKTDSLFYKLFQQFPDTLFALTEQPTTLASSYSFDSVAVKETTFTMDGIFVPHIPGLPLYFVEAQLQKDPDLCSRMLTEIMLYLRHHPPRRNWQAVIIVPTRRHAPELEEAYAMFASYLTIISLKDLSERPEGSTLGVSENMGVELARLITATQRKAPIQARTLLKLTQQDGENPTQQTVEDFISRIMVYKFPKLSRQELESMLELGSIKKTRVYQEALEEGELIGEVRGEARGEARGILLGKLEAVPALHLQNFSVEAIAKILGLTVEQVQSALPNP
jgi:predicted transposase/invertase (TIGR01784 family)